MIQPPRWSSEELEQDRLRAVDAFRVARMQEPLEDYLETFDQYQGVVENLLEVSVDLAQLDNAAIEILTDPGLLEAFRYLAGPPISQDDLRTLGEAVLSPGRLRNDPAMAGRVIEVVRLGLDRRRFAWVIEGREPSEAERAAAVMASAALLATRKVGTDRRHKGKEEQEALVEETFLRANLTKAATRRIETFMDAPAPGNFCRESELHGGKADFVLRLWDNRVMAIECKVSNSAINSVKRLNREAAAKAQAWIRDLGAAQIIPAAVLSGVYKIRNLLDAQERGLTLFWAHDLGQLVAWIERTRD
jgi:XamI restriction endonuclease